MVQENGLLLWQQFVQMKAFYLLQSFMKAREHSKVPGLII
jgi:hypothetical protein